MRISKLVVLLVCAWSTLACSTITPSNFGAAPQKLSVPWSGPIAVSPVSQESPEARFNANGMAFEVNLDDFSVHLAELLKKSLLASGVTVSPGGHSIQLQVVHLDFMFRGPCYVDYTVTLGNGDRYGLQSAGESSNFNTACRKALEAAVSQTLWDRRTSRYLEGE